MRSWIFMRSNACCFSKRIASPWYGIPPTLSEWLAYICHGQRIQPPREHVAYSRGIGDGLAKIARIDRAVVLGMGFLSEPRNARGRLGWAVVHA